MISVKSVADADKRLIREVLAIDNVVYPSCYQGTFDEVYDRFTANRDMFVLLYDDDTLIGYLCLFPICDDLYETILREDRIFDSDIPGSALECYERGKNYRLYLISAAILPNYQGCGLSRQLIGGFYRYLLEKRTMGIFFSTALSTAVTPQGQAMLMRMGFRISKRLPKGCALFELAIDDAIYLLAEKGTLQ